MSQPLLCSLADVKARTAVSIADADLTSLIEAVSNEIEDYAGAWLSPRPTLTLLFDIERTGSSFRARQGDRVCGVRTLTSLGIATTGQPDTAGTYTTVTAANILLRPRPTEDGPATRIVLASGTFTRGFNTVSATGDWGPAAVAPRVREFAIELVAFDLDNGRGVTSESIGDWSASYGRSELMSGLTGLWAVSL